MTIEEFQTLIAGLPPTTPLIDEKYRPVEFRLQAFVHPSLKRDVTPGEAMEGLGIMGVVLCQAEES